MQRLADYVADFLVKQGVTDIFMLTGYGAMYINDAIEQSGIKHFATRNEATAPMMAAAYGRLTGKLGVVCVTAGPGSTNAIPGLAEAWVDSAPVLVISGQVDRKHTTYSANIEGLRTFGTAEINIQPVAEPLTKFAAVVNNPNDIRLFLEKAVYLALRGRPGPVWIDIPLDIQQAMIEPDKLVGFMPIGLERDEPSHNSLNFDIHETAKMLKASRRPLIIAGHGVRQSGGLEEFKQLVNQLNIPVLFSRLGQDLMPHNNSNPCVFGHAGLKGSRYCKKIMQNADVILSLGCRLAPQLVGLDGEAFDKDAKIIMVDTDPAELKKPGLHIDLPVHADVKVFMQKLYTECTHRFPMTDVDQSMEWLVYCLKVKREHPIITDERKRDPIDLYYFMHRLDELSKKHHIFVTDAGSNYYTGGQVWHFGKGQREIASVCNAAMGTTIPLAIGCAVASPKSQILAVTGDGSLELNIQELKTISHYGFNIKLFVINNGGYASMQQWQDNYFEGRRIDTEEKTGVGTLGLYKIAEAFDLEWVLVHTHKEINSRVGYALKSQKPMFIEVVTDPHQHIIEAFEE